MEHRSTAESEPRRDVRTLRPAGRVLWRDLGTTVLIRVPATAGGTGDDFDLNDTGAVVWRMIQPGIAEDTLFDRLGEIAAESASTREEIDAFVDALVQKGAVERAEVEVSPEEPADS